MTVDRKCGCFDRECLITEPLPGWPLPGQHNQTQPQCVIRLASIRAYVQHCLEIMHVRSNIMTSLKYFLFKTLKNTWLLLV